MNLKNMKTLRRKLLPVLHEDESFVFIRKPAGVFAGARGRPGEVDIRALLDAEGGRALLPVYELPAAQSGVLALARTPDALRHLQTGISTGSVKSAFVAVVQGRVKRKAEMVSGVVKRVGKERFVADRRTATVDAPSTWIETLARGDQRTLIRCRLNGLDDRQVRAHLHAAHLRVVGEASPRERLNAAKVIPQQREPLPLMLHLEEVRFHHPGLKKSLSIRTPAPAEFGEALGEPGRREGVGGVVALRLQAALVRRLPLLLSEDTNALRLLHPRGDGVSGLAVDLYGDVLLVQVLQGKFDAVGDRLAAMAEWYRRLLGVRAVYVKHFVKDRSRGAADETSGPLFDPEPLLGDAVEPQFAVQENGLSLLVRAYDGYSTGLFLDQRENRRRVRELAAGKRVLNLFAYTCGFSVAAAAGGAAQTVSVDASVRHLEWGKENFTANGLPLEDHQFIRDDAFNYFKRARRQEQKFDLIIVDPPSFARLKKPKRVFTITNDLRPLLAEAMTVLAPGGVLVVSTNHREATRGWLRAEVESAAGERKVSLVSAPPLPADFAGDAEYMKSLIVRVS